MRTSKRQYPEWEMPRANLLNNTLSLLLVSINKYFIFKSSMGNQRKEIRRWCIHGQQKGFLLFRWPAAERILCIRIVSLSVSPSVRFSIRLSAENNYFSVCVSRGGGGAELKKYFISESYSNVFVWKCLHIYNVISQFYTIYIQF